MEEQRLPQQIEPSNHHIVNCYSNRGFLKWTEMLPNLVTEEGAIWLLDTAFGVGEQKDWFCGLTQAGVISAQDTMKINEWEEYTGTTHQWRPPLNFVPHATHSAAQTYTSDKSAQFIIHEAGTITGSFMVDNNTIGGNSGLLYGITLFNQSHKVIQGDSLHITVILGSKV